jgi:sugar/nucleoside kinase (ribokinase family)
VKFAPLLGQLTYLFTNRREASAMLGRPTDAPASAADLATALAQGHNLAVIVTDGGEALAVASAGTVRTYMPPPVAVRAVNGAGDSFAAGTIAGLAAGGSLDAAVASGMAAAALTLTHGSVAAAPFAPAAIRTHAEAAP